LKTGLIPKFMRSTLTKDGDWEKQPNVVWLTNDPNWILQNQAGSDWCKKHKPITLKVNTKGLKIKYLYHPEYHCYDIIVPERITEFKFREKGRR